MRFTKEQECAVTHREGPMLVVAGPGSGKTLVLVSRILYLVTRCHVSPAEILVITFTKAAALSMRERFERLAKNQLSEKAAGSVSFGTFHAAFLWILKTYGNAPERLRILSEKEQLSLLRECARSIQIEEGRKGEPESEELLLAKLYEIAKQKADLQTADLQTADPLIQLYLSRMRAEGLLDFEDILCACHRLLSCQRQVLDAVRRRFRYLLVDEFQDINAVQYAILRLISGEDTKERRANVFAVGDDDQSIYAFRGAKPEMMKRFLADYPLSKYVLLEDNFRSKGNIVSASKRLIAHNKDRFPKEIKAVRETKGAVELKVFDNDTAEANWLTEQVKAYHEKGILYREMAVLYRTNEGTKAFTAQLINAGIPYQTKRAENKRTDAERREEAVREDICAYLRLSLFPMQRSDLFQIINRPQRNLSRSLFFHEQVDREAVRAKLAGFVPEETTWNTLLTQLDRLKTFNPYAAVSYIWHAIGYESFVKTQTDGIWKGMTPEEANHIFAKLSGESRNYPTLKLYLKEAEGRKETRDRDTRADAHQRKDDSADESGSESSKNDKLALLTMHAAKGLEFEAVFLPDCKSHERTKHSLFQKGKKEAPEEAEEERRIFYVAMTRAKQFLHISYNKANGKPSRFVEEIFPKEEISPQNTAR